MNTILTVLIAALLPVVLLLLYIYRQDKDKPEPVSWLVKAGLYGVISAVLVIVISLPFGDFYTQFPDFEGTVPGAFGDALFSAAIPEEASKLLMLWLIIRKNPYFDEHLDGIVYATCVGLGFAGFENILYVAGNLDSIASVAIIRALFSVPGHFFYAVVMGYYISLACFSTYSVRRRTLYWILAFIVPVILHFIFDAIIMTMQVSSTGLIFVLVITFLLFCHWLRKMGLRKIQATKERDNA